MVGGGVGGGDDRIFGGNWKARTGVTIGDLAKKRRRVSPGPIADSRSSWSGARAYLYYLYY